MCRHPGETHRSLDETSERARWRLLSRKRSLCISSQLPLERFQAATTTTRATTTATTTTKSTPIPTTTTTTTTAAKCDSNNALRMRRENVTKLCRLLGPCTRTEAAAGSDGAEELQLKSTSSQSQCQWRSRSVYVGERKHRRASARHCTTASTAAAFAYTHTFKRTKAAPTSVRSKNALRGALVPTKGCQTVGNKLNGALVLRE